MLGGIGLESPCMNWGGSCRLFFLMVPNRVRLCCWSNLSQSSTLVNQLSVVTFLPVLEIGWINLSTTSAELLLTLYCDPSGCFQT